MDRSVELRVSAPGLRAVRGTTTSLHTGIKEHYGVGRIEHAALLSCLSAEPVAEIVQCGQAAHLSNVVGHGAVGLLGVLAAKQLGGERN